jgi:[acyl-carrier-protein] S-malonyltransferase
MSRTHIALTFPGQGSQRAGMLEQVPDTQALDRLLDAAEAMSDLGLCRIATDGTDAELADTRVAQPLLYLADWAWGTTLLARGVPVAAVAGHSLGELAALAVAGVFSVEAGLELVVERSRLMALSARETPGTMAAVLGLERESVASAIDGIEDVWVANDNAPGQVVISGTHEAVEAAGVQLANTGARRVVPLKVAGPFHSPLMASAADRFAAVLKSTEFDDASIPVYQNTDPTPATNAEIIRGRLIHQITSPVRWTEIMEALVSDGIGYAVEAGPGAVLSGLTKRVDGLVGLSAEGTGVDAIVREVSQ